MKSQPAIDKNPTADITALRNHLVSAFDSLRTGQMDSKELVEINNTAGKIISACKVQLAYHHLRGEAPHIPFIHGNTDTTALPPASGALAAPQP